MTRALRIHAGPAARARLRDRGLRPGDVLAVPGAAGGPKGLVLNALDRFLFGHWLAGEGAPVHLLGASIGAWRMASACVGDADATLAEMARHYIEESYLDADAVARARQQTGRRVPQPGAAAVSRALRARLSTHLGARIGELLQHPRFRLHLFTSHGVHPLLRREGRLRTLAGYAAAYAANLRCRAAMGNWLERVVFSDPRTALPFDASDYAGRVCALRTDNAFEALVASCSIPFWLEAVHDIPGAPPGAYWDGGITDYHLHLDYASALRHRDGADDAPRLVLYPHFQPTVVPGWLDKRLSHRHGATARLDNVVLLVPDADWIARLPNGKLPDRRDFKAYGVDHGARALVWRLALAESQRLADDFAQIVSSGGAIEAEPLARR
jgi:hypothetical protein